MELKFVFLAGVVGYLGILIYAGCGPNGFSELRFAEAELKGVLIKAAFWMSPVFLLSCWGFFYYIGWIDQGVIPGPIEVGRSAVSLIVSGELLRESAISVVRVGVGFTFASVIGITLGLLAGTFRIASFLIIPSNSFLRYIPPTSFIALFIVYFGVGELYKYAVVFFGVLFFLIQMVVDVVEDIDKSYIEMGSTSGFSTRDLFFRVIVPYSLPRLVDVLRINLGAAWTFLVAAELVGADKGLGHLIAVSQRFLRMGDLYAGILTFGVIGLLSDRCLEWTSRRLFRWYYIEIGR